MRGLKLGVLVFSGLLVFGCSSKDSMSKEDKASNEKMKLVLLGVSSKEEFIAKMNKRTSLLSKAEKMLNARGGKPSNVYTPHEAFLINMRKSFQNNHSNSNNGHVNIYSYDSKQHRVTY